MQDFNFEITKLYSVLTKTFSSEEFAPASFEDFLKRLPANRKHIIYDAPSESIRRIAVLLFLFKELSESSSTVVLAESSRKNVASTYELLSGLKDNLLDIIGDFNIYSSVSGVFVHNPREKNIIIGTPEYFYRRKFDIQALGVTDTGLVKDFRRGKILFDVIVRALFSKNAPIVMLGGFNLGQIREFIPKSVIFRDLRRFEVDYKGISDDKNLKTAELIGKIAKEDKNSCILIVVSHRNSVKKLKSFLQKKFKNTGINHCTSISRSEQTPVYHVTPVSGFSSEKGIFNNIIFRDYSLPFGKKINSGLLQTFAFKYGKYGYTRVFALFEKEYSVKSGINRELFRKIRILEKLHAVKSVSWAEFSGFFENEDFHYTSTDFTGILEDLLQTGFMEKDKYGNFRITGAGEFVLDNGLFVTETEKWIKFWRNISETEVFTKFDQIFTAVAIEKHTPGVYDFEPPLENISHIWDEWLKHGKWNVVGQSLGIYSKSEEILKHAVSGATEIQNRKTRSYFWTFVSDGLKRGILPPYTIL